MLLQDFMPMIAPHTVVRTHEEALQALQTHASGTLLGLVEGPRFQSLKVLRSALFELGWAMESAEVDHDGATRLVKATITGAKESTDGWKYRAWFQERNGLSHVILCEVTKFGNGHKPELAKAYKALLDEAKKG